MPSYPLSLRKTRQVVSNVIDASNAQTERLNALTQAVQGLHLAHKAYAESLDSLLERGFVGRLKWLVTGH